MSGFEILYRHTCQDQRRDVPGAGGEPRADTIAESAHVGALDRLLESAARHRGRQVGVPAATI